MWKCTNIDHVYVEINVKCELFSFKEYLFIVHHRSHETSDVNKEFQPSKTQIDLS